jgi:hypothetical protein
VPPAGGAVPLLLSWLAIIAGPREKAADVKRKGLDEPKEEDLVYTQESWYPKMEIPVQIPRRVGF